MERDVETESTEALDDVDGATAEHAGCRENPPKRGRNQ
jgi:hypothetical protein